MTSRLRAAVATLFVVLSLAFMVDAATATPTAARPDCMRPCRF
ncbi:hypothetical protein [Amycolatopsis sp. CA-128772]|nr:hypothetical protein [Amycolatopsis sp. CA-128772]